MKDFNKKAQGLPINAIILAVLALIVLVVIIVIFSSNAGKTSKGISAAELQGYSVQLKSACPNSATKDEYDQCITSSAFGFSSVVEVVEGTVGSAPMTCASGEITLTVGSGSVAAVCLKAK